MPRKHVAWKYANELQGTNRGYLKCSFCKKVCKGGITRIKNHIVGNHDNVNPCPSAPSEVKEELRKYVTLGKKEREENQRDRAERIETGSYYASVEAIGSSKGTNIPARGVRGPIDRYFVDVDDDNYITTKSSSVTPKEARNAVCLDIGRFFFENGIPFHVASSPSFINACRSIGNYGRGLKPPTAYELSSWILKEEEKTTQVFVDEVKKTWVHTGVSILSDGWKDTRGRQLINFLVNNPHGTVFLKSVDASDVIKDANLLFKLLDDVIVEVGEEIVIQVVTDNASNYKAAGRMLMEKRPRLWWTPCAAHCVDLMLEKLGDLPQHKNALIKAKKVSNFIYNHGWVLALMRKHTKKELIRPAATRFATAYLTLQSIHSLRQPLEAMFTSREWSNCSWAKSHDGKMANDRTFWGSVVYAIKTTKPLVSVLRMNDSEKMPGMGFLYGAMDKAKEDIAKNLDNVEESYKEIWSIIDSKWDNQMHRHLHAASYYLNPHFHFDEDFSATLEVKTGLYACMDKLISNPTDREKANLQLDRFHLREGLFGYSQAKATCKKRSPADWWNAFGDEAPELRSFAAKILSLTYSSSACERNWSTFNQIHTKRRNRLSVAKLNSLAYIMYNKKLKDKHIKKKTLNEKDDPLIVDHVPSDDEWVVPEEEDYEVDEVDAFVEANDIVPVQTRNTRVGEIGGSTQSTQRKRKKSTQSNSAKGEGNGLQLIDEEPELLNIVSDKEDESWIRYDDNLMDDDTDDGGAGNDDSFVFDPNFVPLDTDDTLFH